MFYWVAAASGPLALGLFWLAGLSPALVETLYSRALYPFLMSPWSRLTGLVPFPIAPVLVPLLVLGALSLFFIVPPLRALSLIGAGLSMLVAWFVLGWGLNYQRSSWAENHALVTRGGTVSDLEALAVRLATPLEVLRNEAVSLAPEWDSQDLRAAVTQAYRRAGAADALLAGDYGDPKAFPWPELMSWVGIAGICIPHTGEPLVNPGPNDWQLPFTTAHEAAHLRGWAREDEANFLAFWVLRDDPRPELRYSAWATALLYVASALDEAGPEGQAAWGRVSATLNEGVREDWKNSFAYWDRFKGPAREVSKSVNDLYLKSQGQSDGVKSYGRMVDLLLASGAAESASEPGLR